MKIISIIVALIPIFIFLVWIYKKDKYDKEPIRNIVKFYVMGILISFIAMMIEKVLLGTTDINNICTAFIVVALTEEILKWIVLTKILFKENKFNEKLDGIIYSVVVSLGFASIENIMYMIIEEYELMYRVGMMRAIISIPAHIMFGIIMGYYISKAKFDDTKIKMIEYKIKALIIPIILHGVFDFILMIEKGWSIIVFIVYIGFLYFTSLKKLDEYTDVSKKRFFRIHRRRGGN